MSRDARIAAVAALQHGVVSVGQLRREGLDKHAIRSRVKRGLLHRVHQGVYAVGHAPVSDQAWWMAAVLACGAGAVLSHASAAALWGLLRPLEGPVDVSVPVHSGRRRRDGIRLHRRAALAGAALARGQEVPPIPAVTVHDGIPVTAPWLTIDDLRGALPSQLHRRAVREAELRRFALSPRTPRDGTRSDVERDFLALCRRHRLPPPEVNVRIGRWTVDFLWRAERLVVEADTWGTHGGSVAFEDDHARDLELRRRGFSVCRYTDRQIRGQPGPVAADLRERLRGVAPA